MPLGRWWGSTASLVELSVFGAMLLIVFAAGLPGFFRDGRNQRDSEAIAAAQAARSAAEQIADRRGGVYGGLGGVTTERLRSLDSSLDGDRIAVIGLGRRAYRIRVFSDSGAFFDVGRNRNGTLRRSCAPRGEGRCGDGGTW